MIAYILSMISEIVFSVELNRSPIVTVGKVVNERKVESAKYK